MSMHDDIVLIYGDSHFSTTNCSTCKEPMVILEEIYHYCIHCKKFLEPFRSITVDEIKSPISEKARNILKKWEKEKEEKE